MSSRECTSTLVFLYRLDLHPCHATIDEESFADLIPFSAHKMGNKCAWINRPKAIMGVQGRGEQPDFELSSMEAFANEMEKVKR